MSVVPIWRALQPHTIAQGHRVMAAAACIQRSGQVRSQHPHIRSTSQPCSHRTSTANAQAPHAPTFEAAALDEHTKKAENPSIPAINGFPLPPTKNDSGRASLEEWGGVPTTGELFRNARARRGAAAGSRTCIAILVNIFYLVCRNNTEIG